MATDDRTPTQNFPRPHIDNTVAEDFARIITLVNMLEAKISAMDIEVSGKAAVGHDHAIAGVTGLQAALDGKQSSSWRPALGDLSNVNVTGAVNGQLLGLVGTAWQPMTLSVAWGNVSGKPSSFPTTWDDVAGKPVTFTPSAHSHPISEIASLQASLDAIATAAASKLPLAGGTMSGALYGTSATFSSGVVGGAVDSGNAFQINNSLNGVIGAICPINNGGGNYSIGVYGYGGAAGSGWRAIYEHTGTTRIYGTTIIGNDATNNFVHLEKQGAVEICNATYAPYIDWKFVRTDDFLYRTMVSGTNFEIISNVGATLRYPLRLSAYGAIMTRAGWVGADRQVLTTKGDVNQSAYWAYVGQLLASEDTQGIGQTVCACDITGARNAGDLQSGANLRFSSSVNNQSAGSLIGTWRCHGQTTGAGQSTNWQRIA